MLRTSMNEVDPYAPPALLPVAVYDMLGDTWVFRLAVSASGRLVAAASSKRNTDVVVFEAKSGEVVVRKQRFPEGEGAARALAFSPDETKLLVVGESRGIAVMDLLSEEKELVVMEVTGLDTLQEEFHPFLDRDPRGTCWDIKFVGDGHVVMCTHQTIDIVRTDTWTSVLKLKNEEQEIVYALAVSPCGQYLASGLATGRILIHRLCVRAEEDHVSAVLVSVLFMHSENVWCLQFHPSRPDVLLSASEDSNILVSNWRTGHVLASDVDSHTDCVWSARFTRSGDHIVSGSWDRKACISSVTFSKDESWAQLKPVHVTRDAFYPFVNILPTDPEGAVRDIVITPDDQFVFLSSDLGPIVKYALQLFTAECALSFLLGLKTKVGPIKQDFADSPMYDRNLISVVFSYLRGGGVEFDNT